MSIQDAVCAPSFFVDHHICDLKEDLVLRLYPSVIFSFVFISFQGGPPGIDPFFNPIRCYTLSGVSSWLEIFSIVINFSQKSKQFCFFFQKNYQGFILPEAFEKAAAIRWRLTVIFPYFDNFSRQVPDGFQMFFIQLPYFHRLSDWMGFCFFVVSLNISYLFMSRLLMLLMIGLIVLLIHAHGLGQIQSKFREFFRIADFNQIQAFSGSIEPAGVFVFGL